MKRLLLLSAAILLLAVQTSFAQEQKQQQQSQMIAWSVAFRIGAGDSSKYVTMQPQGGLDASGTKLTAKQIFTLVDLGGGDLKGGDSIMIRLDASLWREDKDASKVHRVPARGAKTDECTFKLLLKGKNVILQTASGKYVAVAADGKSIGTTNNIADATLFELIPNPQPQT
jgi:hypothetical protein